MSASAVACVDVDRVDGVAAEPRRCSVAEDMDSETSQPAP